MTSSQVMQMLQFQVPTLRTTAVEYNRQEQNCWVMGKQQFQIYYIMPYCITACFYQYRLPFAVCINALNSLCLYQYLLVVKFLIFTKQVGMILSLKTVLTLISLIKQVRLYFHMLISHTFLLLVLFLHFSSVFYFFFFLFLASLQNFYGLFMKTLTQLF